tara:strand:- start:88 stop:225 length:138 start_codon:yes stop_codon:yes gene_type:complete
MLISPPREKIKFNKGILSEVLALIEQKGGRQYFLLGRLAIDYFYC